jgi:hypothetical protein
MKPGIYQHTTYKNVRAKVEEDCTVYLTVKFKRPGVAYRDMSTGKLTIRLLADFNEHFSLIE